MKRFEPSPLRRVCLGLALLLAGLVALSAADTATAAPETHSLFFSANQAFREGDHARAVQGYEALVRAGKAGADVYYNLGNAWFRMGQLGRAIVNYERAAILAPRDPDIEYNLRFAKERRVDEVENPGGITPFGWLKKVTGREVFFAFAGINLMFFLVLGLRVRWKWEWTWYAAIALFILWALAAAAGGVKWYQTAADNRGVVVEDQVEVRAGPHPEDTLLFVLHAGSPVQVERTEQGWRLIRFSEDKRGWTPAPGIEPIRPLVPESAEAQPA
ncbi:MAG: tetratricopeptide repeat protein [Deltaproteobacteria bacterium]|nr:tetratricopeptide repeat protein [Deltaproteobacteria bacterium]